MSARSAGDDRSLRRTLNVSIVATQEDSRFKGCLRMLGRICSLAQEGMCVIEAIRRLRHNLNPSDALTKLGGARLNRCCGCCEVVASRSKTGTQCSNKVGNRKFHLSLGNRLRGTRPRKRVRRYDEG